VKTVVLNPLIMPTSWDSRRHHAAEMTADALVEGVAEKADLDPAGEVKGYRDIIGKHAHMNFLSYLEFCWGNHLAPIIGPDVIWYTLLCEIALLVKAKPEKFRHLFSHTQEKQLILVQTDDPVRLPMNLIIDQLRRCVPSDTDTFLPSFTTSSERSKLAFYAAFADTCSPFYNYGMLLCDFPRVTVLGTQEDWDQLALSWAALPSELFPTEYFKAVSSVLVGLRTLRDEPDFWRKMFKLTNCGSGHQTEVSGWIVDLFVSVKRPSYTRNFSTHASRVDYKNVTTNREYSLFAGLFSSDVASLGDIGMDGQPVEDSAAPYFGSFVVEKKALPPKKADAEEEYIVAFREGKVRAVFKDGVPVTGGVKKLRGVWTTEVDQSVEMYDGLGR
jgi:hypothetical protein